MIPVCPLAALPRGEARRLGLDPPVAVFHTDDGEVYAVDDTCTHQDASLADGWLEGREIECPLHASRFDLRTGRVDAPPAKRPVRTHGVVVRDGMIYVVPSEAPPEPPPGVAAGRSGSGT
ncbi:bifunctional 3-phenylpropionate/cinnamic acid dioxygenase ferredoxin subunit [Sphaerisporangium sp. TRM90804]|uniref:bifunctional 3-phenylpropionate/cinnamic acid dioxygenase ferredoxin subunit n=1 Tax=Sphaerisporangium sp. TRM90804 TaxID=3031113 RepID=UPI002447D6E6|nr:bifunctional 3-phenylpropionate/cinnamic acid dioxygenase ferredoxin subunit [Sphaerisporangium sp. TRM90804]MDH2429231.1 bifunctional 3-phenylpropionate/cinnamic acid dioxygenase ferredoxin subunit [Sphaerisporangium sp. TRM90804]